MTVDIHEHHGTITVLLIPFFLMFEHTFLSQFHIIKSLLLLYHRSYLSFTHVTCEVLRYIFRSIVLRRKYHANVIILSLMMVMNPSFDSHLLLLLLLHHHMLICCFQFLSHLLSDWVCLI